jgi:hypothetical protein
MKRRITLSLLIVLMAVIAAQAQRRDFEVTEVLEPVPPIVTPGIGTSAPSDAIVLFNGTSLNNWVGRDGNTPQWTLTDGAMTVKPGSGDIKTKQGFGDVQLHLEWKAPEVVKGEGQGRGNSGVFLMGRYEIQVLDCYQNTTYPNGQTASVYKQHIPLANVCRKPGEWQTYDIIFTAPRFNEQGRVSHPARVTVIHNGVLVQNNVELWGSTEFIGLPTYKVHGAKEPISLQDHGDLVSFRNIWIREL